MISVARSLARDERPADSPHFRHLGEDRGQPHLEHLPQAAHLRPNPGRRLRHKGGRHRGRGPGVPSPKGTRTTTRVPRPGLLLTFMRPPGRSTRSRMAASPTPAVASPGSMPRPSSESSTTASSPLTTHRAGGLLRGGRRPRARREAPRNRANVARGDGLIRPTSSRSPNPSMGAELGGAPLKRARSRGPFNQGVRDARRHVFS